MNEIMLEFRDVNVFYGAILALQNVSLTVNQGETVALIGANGAGKSTLLMSIFGQPHIRSGQILFRGEDIAVSPRILSPPAALLSLRKGGVYFQI